MRIETSGNKAICYCSKCNKTDTSLFDDGVAPEEMKKRALTVVMMLAGWAIIDGELFCKSCWKRRVARQTLEIIKKAEVS